MKPRLILVLSAFALTATLAGVATAANPHVTYATTVFNSPTVVAPANITWDGSLTVQFQVAGLAKNQAGITATLNATSNINVNQLGQNNYSTMNLPYVLPGASNITVTQIVPNPPGHNYSNIAIQGTTATLTSDAHGQVTASLTIPANLAASTDGSECVQMSWTSISLTVGTIVVNVPDVSNAYDSTGSFCS
jgi:hypothetical protein